MRRACFLLCAKLSFCYVLSFFYAVEKIGGQLLLCVAVSYRIDTARVTLNPRRCNPSWTIGCAADKMSDVVECVECGVRTTPCKACRTNAKGSGGIGGDLCHNGAAAAEQN